MTYGSSFLVLKSLLNPTISYYLTKLHDTGSKRKRSEDEAGEVQEPLKSSEEDESEESDDDSDEDEDDSEEDEDEEEHDRTKLARQKPSDTVKGKGVKSRRKGASYFTFRQCLTRY